MKKILVFVALIGACVGLAVGTVSAHVLKVDDEISAELHIEPDDNPVSGKPATYELFFDDTSGHFSLADCNCVVDIQQGGRTVTTQPLHATGALASENTVTFSEPGAYTLRVSGQPKKVGGFQPFTLEFPEHIAAAGGADVQPLPRILAVGLGIGMALILLAAYKQNADFTKKNHKK